MDDQDHESAAEQDVTARETRFIVFDAEQESRARLSDALQRLGHSVLEASTPLEAVYAMSRAAEGACVAFVGGCLAATTPREFVSFALEEFPRLLLVTGGVDVEVDEQRVHRLPLGDDASALGALLSRLLTPPVDATQTA